MLRDAPGHDAFLLDALSGAGRRYTIVSPWVIVSTMERVGILAAFEAAVQRGAAVDCSLIRCSTKARLLMH